MLSLLVLFAAISQCQAQHSPPPPCDPVEGSTEAHASWVQVATSPGAMHLSHTQGSTRDFTVSNADKWGSNAASKAGISFIIGNSSSGHSGASVAASYRSHFMAATSTTDSTFSFAAGPGVVWQFQFEIKDSCGVSVVKGNDFVETIGTWAEPCCLPGFFKNAAYANGDCHGFTLTNAKVCNINPVSATSAKFLV